MCGEVLMKQEIAHRKELYGENGQTEVVYIISNVVILYLLLAVTNVNS